MGQETSVPRELPADLTTAEAVDHGLLLESGGRGSRHRPVAHGARSEGVDRGCSSCERVGAGPR
jgi:hypothetical protein